jgi:hypothetical protein
MRKFIHVVVGALALGFSIQIAQAAPKTFVSPKIGPNRLDFCLNWGSGCGEPAATAWCQSKGFNKSIDSEMDADIGASSPTRLIATGAVCDQPYCDGFTFITCASALAPPPPLPPPPLPPATAKQIFFKPRYNADAWCEDQGFDEAIKFKIASGVGPLKPTIQIGSEETLIKPLANAFRSITCVK